MLNGMALFAGIGGIEVGLKKWVRTICYVEWEYYAIAVLRSRIEEGKIDDAPIWDDVRTFDGNPWRRLVDIITLGFPCQDISTAGKGRGIKEGTRSGLWFQGLRIINEVRPTFIFVENVSALTNRGLDIVLGCLSKAGYDARWTDLRASDVGARHRRERMFILAYTNKHRKPAMPINDSEGQGKLWENMADTKSQQRDAQGFTSREKENNTRFGKPSEHPHRKDVAHSCSIGLQTPENIKELERTRFNMPGWENDPANINPSSKSFVGRVANGIPNRVDRIKCLGNAVVPKQAERAWEILTNNGCL